MAYSENSICLLVYCTSNKQPNNICKSNNLLLALNLNLESSNNNNDDDKRVAKKTDTCETGIERKIGTKRKEMLEQARKKSE